MRLAYSIIIALLLFACAQAPTVVTESDLSVLDRAKKFESQHRPIKIDNDTVVLDTRAYFDFQVARVPNSLSINANEFSLRGHYGNDLQNKAVTLARRLALIGVNPFSHVVVIGYGDKGKGEEGIVAFTLIALGVEHVQMGTVFDFRALLRNKPDVMKPNQRNWEPRLVSSLICSPLNQEATFVIDVGRAKKSTALSAKSLATLPMNWKDFVNKEDFSPNAAIKMRLEKEKVTTGSRLMVSGLNAPIVAFSLLQLGYSQVCVTD